jgi:hypothetical protein
MSRLKKILLGLLIVLIVIQFIRPAHNTSTEITQTDLLKTYNVPDSVQAVLKTACYDCHSNNTNYPWYTNIQPIGWMMANHVKEGKAELNFSEFGSYSLRKQQHKLKSIGEEIEEGDMPIASYKLMHSNARLTKSQQSLLIDWATKMQDSLKKISEQ